MIPKQRYLTKSLFSLSRDCASRLYYAKKDEYPSIKDEDEFLQSLAEGGMQVGELACRMHPGGHAIETLNSANCWKKALGWDEGDFQEPHIFDLWNGRSFYGNMMEKGIYHLKDVAIDDLAASPYGITTKNREWDTKERQTVQILIETGGIAEDEILLNPLYEKMNNWSYPLHFLDFEALRLAIPFLKGRRPYEQLAFQFSVHTMQGDGTVTHSAEWIDRKRGTFPNYECVRQLKSALDKYNGTIFQYTHFENLPNYETGEEFIADGGSAMMAYARMQFDDVSQEERDAVFNALSNYCELDTLAMVMIVEAWRGTLKTTPL